MEVLLSYNYMYMMDIFSAVFYEDRKRLYSQKGFQCYKLYLFLYFFGCVREEDLPLIFEGEGFIYAKSRLDLKNAFRSRVNHWVKMKELEKVGKDGFILTSTGLEKLYKHLKEEYEPWNEEFDYEYFKKGYSPRSQNISHASNTGITVLMLARMLEAVFWYEPMLNYAGNMMTGDFYKYGDCMLIPDAVMISTLDEKIYVEADNCTERKTSALYPKFHKYAEVMLSNKKDLLKSTIHFSVQHSNTKNLFESEYYKVKYIFDMYKFLVENLKLKFSFDRWVEFLKCYRGSWEPAARCSEYLENIPNDACIDSLDTLIRFLKKSNMCDVCDKYFLTRQKYIFEAIAEDKQLCTYASEGVRMVCLPKSAPKYLSKCIYIEAVPNREIKQFLERKLKFKIHRIIYKSDQRTVQSERTGDTATFRHMFEIINNEIGKSYLVAIENVSDDYGGRLRIKHYLSCVRDWVCEGEHDYKFLVVCLYNKKVVENPLGLFPYGERRAQGSNICFADYDEFVSCFE